MLKILWHPLYQTEEEEENGEVFDFKKIGTAKEQQQQIQQRMNNVSYGSI